MHKFIEAPTFYPSAEDFKDPVGFLSQPAVVAVAELYGLLKIVPPEGWKPPFSINKENFRFHTRLQKLRELNLNNRPKIFFHESLQNFLNMKIGAKKGDELEEIVKLADGRSVELYLLFQITDYEINKNQHELINWSRVNRFFQLSHDDVQLRHIYDQNLRGYSKYLKQKRHLISHVRQPLDDDDLNGDHCLICFKKDDPQRTLICDGCDEAYHMKCLSPPLTKIPDSDWYCDLCLLGTFDYGFEEDFDSLFTVKEFELNCDEFEKNYFLKHFGSEERPSLDKLEQEFWRLVDGTTLDEEDKELEMRYGADIHNSKLDEISGFPTSTNPIIDTEDPEVEKYIEHPFNLTNLPFAEGSLLNYIKDSEISGMTVPWIYVGSLFSTFCWHKEDHYTLSSNYCHFGSTKKWYGIPAKYDQFFEKILLETAPDYFKRQPDLLHQLITLLSPSQIFERAQGQDMTIVYADQNANEFIITYPKVYHAGFNSGLNFNELVNFTMPYWIKDADSAIKNYKLVHKENVFNYYQLAERILQDFLDSSSEKLQQLQQRYPADFLKMIKICNSDFSDELHDSFHLKNEISLLFPHMSQHEFVKPELEIGAKTRGRKKKLQEDELLCDVCKTFLSFNWVELNNRNTVHDTTDNAQLPTPEHTPKMADDESKICEESEFQRIINEAKKLSDVTKVTTRAGLGISTVELPDEPILKRRRRSKPVLDLPIEELPVVKSKKHKLCSIKLCLADFLKMARSEDTDMVKKVIRSFDNDDINDIITQYGSIIYDCDESDASKLVERVNGKLKDMVLSK